MRETWAVDGFTLTDGLVRDVEYRDGLNQTPVATGGGQAVAGDHGELPGSRLKFGPGSFVLNLWLGNYPVSALQDDYRTLVRALGQVHRLHTFERGMADGSVITCRGRLASGLQPTHLGQNLMRVSAEVYVPGAFWYDLAVTSDATAAGAIMPKDLLLDSKAAATAPMGHLVYTIVGPINNPGVAVTSDPEVDDGFNYNGMIAAGQQLIVDSGEWNLTGTGGFVPDPTLFAYTGDRFLEVPPAMPGLIPEVRLTGNTTGSTTRLTVSGQAAYLC